MALASEGTTVLALALVSNTCGLENVVHKHDPVSESVNIIFHLCSWGTSTPSNGGEDVPVPWRDVER